MQREPLDSSLIDARMHLLMKKKKNSKRGFYLLSLTLFTLLLIINICYGSQYS